LLGYRRDTVLIGGSCPVGLLGVASPFPFSRAVKVGKLPVAWAMETWSDHHRQYGSWNRCTNTTP